MSDEQRPSASPEPGGNASGGPEPEAIRFFGTTWLHHDGGYGLRRAGVAVGSLALAAAGAAVLRFAFQGLEIAAVGPFVGILVVAGFAICSALAFRRTWDGFVRRRDPAAESAADKSAQSLMFIGFIGSLLAYFCRSLVEAPGEKLHRTEYTAARERHERRRGARTGNPAAKKPRPKKRR
ncbi:hypothetical protein SLV14_003370 [Streptomyces sp. Je 1-4]|uniref:hypothetical protein n=1 Tax=Streptomyces TaxID=1883 RepID=UPI00140F3D2D|nr:MULTISPECIES: hypothetical protein [unclassified Streptomyces]QIK07256.1 hypothetical protein G7Z12_15605 [Streptomyces sp. ID38640]UYB40711.1 hypothetical protein SLV14_003370 [Streptomyces sp. Je 1-4]UZQ36854.1 hypothetical protein SLV14N_003370 [Streptomyces sp. Je 1-4] [Streptomyces sp. Je 1-4 4N24]UZQ44271.1 hypothetical protein SLV14NA_003370 [Streptomyces sp. Je 1-4] [Streptomyces sp. Je 1-4 4N24_ara]